MAPKAAAAQDRSQELPSREAVLFRTLVKHYEVSLFQLYTNDLCMRRWDCRTVDLFSIKVKERCIDTLTL